MPEHAKRIQSAAPQGAQGLAGRGGANDTRLAQLQAAADASPAVQRLAAMQSAADASPAVQRLAAMQRAADARPTSPPTTSPPTSAAPVVQRKVVEEKGNPGGTTVFYSDLDPKKERFATRDEAAAKDKVLSTAEPGGPSTAKTGEKPMTLREFDFIDDTEKLAVLDRLPAAQLYILVKSLAQIYKAKGQAKQPDYFRVATKRLESAFAAIQEQLDNFCAANNYAYGKRLLRALSIHELFGTQSVSLYPVAHKNLGALPKPAHRPHRPILDLEIIGGEVYARCYLGLYSKAPPNSKFKDVTADDSGAITLTNIGLMNLGNPLKALLWCEDYLTSTEHFDNKHPPKPVVRAFLIPLSQASDMLRSDGDLYMSRPLDQDRGAGQFGNRGDSETYSKVLRPLIGSLVSFFHDEDDLAAEGSKPAQVVRPMSDLQAFLTGQAGDLLDLAQDGIAAQHGRGDHRATLNEDYADVIGHYYEAVEGAGFTPATSASEIKRRKVQLPEKIKEHPYVAAKAKLLGPDDFVRGAAMFPVSKASADAKAGKPSAPGDSRVPPNLALLRQFIEAYEQLPVRRDPDEGVPLANSSEGLKPVASLPEMKEASSAKAVASLPEMKAASSAKAEPSTSRARVEPADASNQYASVDGGGGNVLSPRLFNRLGNPGGGDCLFHALEGRTLGEAEMLRVRAEVADIRAAKPDTELSLNANANIAAATITQSPALMNFSALVEGRDQVPNEVLARLQRILGSYAGEQELIQWCELRRRTVTVIDQDGTIKRYDGSGCLQSFVFKPGEKNSDKLLARIEAIVTGKTLVLFKSPDHWEKVTGSAFVNRAGSAGDNM